MRGFVGGLSGRVTHTRLLSMGLLLLVSSCSAAETRSARLDRSRSGAETSGTASTPAPPATPSAEPPSVEHPSLNGPSTVSTFRFVFHVNMHTGFGAQGRRRSSLVRLEMFETGGARLDDVGESSGYVMHSGAGNPRVRRTTRPWQDRFEGAWVRDGETLALALRSTASECQETTTEPPLPEAEAPCGPLPDVLHLACAHPESADLPDAWICTSASAMDNGPRTDLPWGFEEGGCLMATLGGGRLSRRVGYERCPEDGTDEAP